MPVQAPQWSEYLSCPVCQNEFEAIKKPPVSLACGHTACRTCLESLQRRQCPFDQTPIGVDLALLPVNTALLQLIGNGEVPEEYRKIPDLPVTDKEFYSLSLRCIEELALYLKPSQSSQLSRPMQRKLVTLVNCQLLEVEGRARGARAARSLGERSVTELILQHQNPQQLSANLWAAVRARGCQFLGPAMQEEVLKLVLLALEDGSALSRKVLVMFVVQRLEPHFPQASKTSIGHVVQLLYRASCFKVTKRDGDSSLMQLKEEFRTYETLRREHDTQIVQIATEGGLRIAPDQWSSLLYGDSAHKSHMQSIIDKLQTPQSFGQSVQELVIALQRTGDPGRLATLRPQLDTLTNIDPSPESEHPDWQTVMGSLQAAKAVVAGLISFCSMSGHRKSGESFNGHVARYKTSMCRDLATHGSCPRGHNCTFAHSQQELEMHRNGTKKTNTKPREPIRHQPSPVPVKQSPVPILAKPKRHESGEMIKAVHNAPVAAAGPAGAAAAAPPVAQVAPIPRVLTREIHMDQVQHVTPIVDQNGTPMIDAATGQPLVATPVVAQSQVFQGQVHIAGADGGLYTVQPGTPIHMATLQVAPTMMVAGGPNQTGQVQMQMPNVQIAHNATHVIMQNAMIPQHHVVQQEVQRRDIKHDLSPEIASKSLSALKDRKEEILSELGSIVGTSNAQVIGDMASQQAASNERFGLDLEAPEIKSRRNSLQTNQEPSASGTYGMWTSKPLVTMSSLYEPQQKNQQNDEDVDPLPDGICVSRFGPISRQLHGKSHGHRATSNTEPTAVTAIIGQNTRPTSSVRQPLPATSPVPEGLMIMQDQNTVFEYDPGSFSDYFIQEGMDSVSMSHLINPPMMPISPLPNPRDQAQRLTSQNLSMYAESARIQKELHDLQRRISCLNVAENSNHMAMKRDRLAIELRMIESGIRERHNEIHQNQTYPHSEMADQDNLTEYTYW
eukprot:GFUD01063827.1.p1 GENE.GFUD01063827.1~~GFUD01063827.1.p1  ORF type:complete len:955 (-),score=170.59 GFUD01063827.1:2224-5088(-)